MCKCNPFKYKVCLCSVNSIHRYNEDYHELKTISKCISITLLPCCYRDVDFTRLV